MPDRPGLIEAVGDEVLARRIAEGPHGATDGEEAELYRRFAPRVRLYGRRHLQDAAAADDLVQEVLLCTIDRLRSGDVRQPEQIGSFILGTARTMVQAERRTTRRREALRARYTATTVGTAPASFAMLDVPRVTACLQALDERDRIVVMLTYYADREAPSIAADLGITPGAVRVIRHRAMGRLRECVRGGARA